MTNREIIEKLQIVKAEVEWNYPLDYAIAIDEAIKKLELMEEKNDRPEIQDSKTI